MRQKSDTGVGTNIDIRRTCRLKACCMHGSPKLPLSRVSWPWIWNKNFLFSYVIHTVKWRKEECRKEWTKKEKKLQNSIGTLTQESSFSSWEVLLYPEVSSWCIKSSTLLPYFLQANDFTSEAARTLVQSLAFRAGWPENSKLTVRAAGYDLNLTQVLPVLGVRVTDLRSAE